jgi:uncharacterized protein DUF2569
MVVPGDEEVNEVTDPSPGIGGWLALLCLLLLVWRPLNLAIVTAGTLGSLTFRGLPMALVVVAQLLVTGMGVSAGLALINRSRGAARFAMWSLILSACMDVFVYSTSFLPNRRMPGTTPAFIAASLIYHGVWIAYLSRSKRVRNTFPAA